MKLAFRPCTTPADRTFVLANWLDASRTSYSSGLIAMEDWYSVMWPQYEKARTRAGMQTIVAYEATDPEFMYGFVIADPTEQRTAERDGAVKWWPALVLFVFVKQNYRRGGYVDGKRIGDGIARRLFAEVGVDPLRPFLYGCNTQQASRLASKVPHAKFSPLTARFAKEKAA